MEYSFDINKIDHKKNVININNIDRLDNGNKYYDDKIIEYINNIADSKFIIEITKFCGYSHLMVVYKEDSLLDLYIDISKQMWCDNILGLFALIKKNENDGTLNIKKIPLTAHTTLREFFSKNKMRPIYSIERPCVYRVFIDDGPNLKEKENKTT